MDSHLHRLLHSGFPPFSGHTLSLPELVPLDQLASMLTALASHLQAMRPSETLLRHEDWHEHDGYITSSEPCTWTELLALVASAEALYANRPGDDFVRTGVYAESGAFYLRIWVPDENDDEENYVGRWGTFDISTSEEGLADFASAVPRHELLRSESRSFFLQRGA